MTMGGSFSRPRSLGRVSRARFSGDYVIVVASTIESHFEDAKT